MFAINLEKNSWQVRIAQFGGLPHYETDTDICRITRCYIWALIKALAIAGGLIVISVVAFFGVLYPMLAYMLGIFGLHLPHPFFLRSDLDVEEQGLFVWGLFEIFLVIGFSILQYRKWDDKTRAEMSQPGYYERQALKRKKEPNFLYQMYCHWKAKTCVKVTINEQE